MIHFHDQFRDLHLVPGLLSGYRGPVLPAGEAWHVAQELGTVVLQQIKGDGFALSFWHIQWRTALLYSITLEVGLHSFFLSEGETGLTLPGARYRLRPSQFVLVPEGAGICTLEPRKGRDVLLLHARFDNSFAEELSPAFPDPFLALAQPRSKKQRPFTAGPPLRDTVQGLLHADYEPTRLPFYYKMKLTEYLFKQLDGSLRSREIVVTATDWELEAVHKVYGFILQDILKHHKIHELAAHVRMDRVRLQALFRQVFGLSPYDLLLQARLDRVKELMEGGMPMKEAAPLAGYAHTTSFINAFKKRYGYPPGSMFRKK